MSSKKNVGKALGLGAIKELLLKIKKLQEEGYGKLRIAKELELPMTKLNDLLKELTANPPKESAKPAPTIVHKTEEDTHKRVARLVDRGTSVIDIAKELDITLNSALYWVDKVKRGGKHSVVDEIRKALDSESYETYDLAKRYTKSPTAIKRLVKRAEMDFSPVDDWIKQASRRGVLYSRLKRELGIKSLDKAKQVVKDAFKDCFIVVTPQGKEDYILMPIHSSKEEIEWSNSHEGKRKFDYHISPEGNYMCVKFHEDFKAEDIVIWNLTDLHEGSNFFRPKVLDSIIELISSKPNHFAVLGGDLTETLTKISVGDPMDQYLTNSEQLLAIVKRLRPIAHKIIAYRGGNHCVDRLVKAGSFNQGPVIGSMLGVPFFDVRVTIDIFYGTTRKTITLEHRYGNAFSAGAVEAAIDKVQAYNTFFVNCIFVGHNHRAHVLPKESLELLVGEGFVARRWWIANGGSTMQRTGSYAEKANYGPTPQDFVYYTFNTETGHDEARLHRVDSI